MAHRKIIVVDDREFGIQSVRRISQSIGKPVTAVDTSSISDLREEYELIKAKKSKLPASQRERIVRIIEGGGR